MVIYGSGHAVLHPNWVIPFSTHTHTYKWSLLAYVWFDYRDANGSIFQLCLFGVLVCEHLIFVNTEGDFGLWIRKLFETRNVYCNTVGVVVVVNFEVFSIHNDKSSCRRIVSHEISLKIAFGEHWSIKMKAALLRNWRNILLIFYTLYSVCILYFVFCKQVARQSL